MIASRSIILVSVAVASGCGLSAARAAETLRNPPGTTAAPSTMRNPPDTMPGRSSDKPAPVAASEPTRTPLGADATAPAPAASFGTSGPAPVEPGRYAPGTVGVGEATPGVLNSAGANGETTPQGTTGVRPNGGAADNGSKPAPMQENGVRKVE